MFRAASALLSITALATLSGCLEAPLSLEDPRPVADAGWDQVRYLRGASGLAIDLDGRASCDPVGAPIDSATWTVVQAPPNSIPTVSTAGDLQALFEAATPGSYLIALTITAQDRESDADFVLVEIREGDGEDIFIEAPDTDLCGIPIS